MVATTTGGTSFYLSPVTPWGFWYIVEFTPFYCKTMYKGQEIKPIDGEITMKIIEFIRNYRRKNFLVHCQAGVSRSAAVALFIQILTFCDSFI